MILGNNCDIEDKRQVSKERGESVSRNLNLEQSIVCDMRGVRSPAFYMTSL